MVHGAAQLPRHDFVSSGLASSQSLYLAVPLSAKQFVGKIEDCYATVRHALAAQRWVEP